MRDIRLKLDFIEGNGNEYFSRLYDDMWDTNWVLEIVDYFFYV